MSRVLVTGATGNVGRHVVARLASAGTEVRALVRDARITGFPASVEVTGGDLTDPASLESAAAGIDTVFLVWPFLTTEAAPAVLKALATRVRRVVYLSSSAVNDAGPQTDPIPQLHADMEELIKRSGLEWTILRADTIASNALGWAGQIRATGIVRGPEIAPTAVVHEDDIAAVAARLLTENLHAGRQYIVTGPRVVSRSDQVHAIGQAIGRPLAFEAMPLDVARDRMLADGRPPALVEALLATAAGRPRSDLVTGTVEEFTGSPARDFRDWAGAHAADFG
ncbi:NAD(P)H-binding protein [Nocardia sp. NPDC051030]|uniref:NAD(P)H-binding protein n=1 Tax=Nocardia sp. NPDC051030 TaxID=3155162 RepID=UPI003437E78A